MQLAPDERELFTRLYNSLLKFVDEKLEIVPPEGKEKPDYETLIAVRDALFENRQLIDAFVKENPCNFSPEELEIVSNWKYARNGLFYILRNLKQHTTFVGSTKKYEPSEGVFAVLPLNEPFEKIIKPPLPVLVRTALLPFHGRIVFDGIMSFYEVDFGPKVRQSLDGCYKYAKEHFGIITSLTAETQAAL